MSSRDECAFYMIYWHRALFHINLRGVQIKMLWLVSNKSNINIQKVINEIFSQSFCCYSYFEYVCDFGLENILIWQSLYFEQNISLGFAHQLFLNNLEVNSWNSTMSTYFPGVEILVHPHQSPCYINQAKLEILQQWFWTKIS